MVSFTSITQGIILVSAIILTSSSDAAPLAADKATNATTPAVHHINATDATPAFTLPPIIPSRTKPVSHPEFAGNLDAETDNIKKNKEWFIKHGGNFNNLTKRDDSNTKGGMTMDLPANITLPPIPATANSASVVTATVAQIQEYTSFAGIASTGYCRSVVPFDKWDCKNCLKYVPDGKLLVTFTALLSDTHGFVLRSDKQKTIHLVFRGTNSIRNAITDLTFELTDYPPVKGAKVHTGFLGSYNEVVNSFFPVIQAQLDTYPNYRVVVSGHSLGGAQSLIAAMDLYQREKRLGPKNLSIYTIGCPRVGNPAFAYYVDSTGIPLHRSVNNRDIVPHLPPQSFGFLHPGVEIWSRTPTTAQICTANIETSECSNSIVPFTDIIDHLSYYDINEGLCL